MRPEAMSPTRDPKGVEHVKGNVDGQNLCYHNNTLKIVWGWSRE